MFKISFDFDETSKKVSNMHVEEVKTKEVLQEGSFVTVLDSKLQLTEDTVKLLGASAGDRIVINYYTVDNENTFPVIGKADAFTDASDGNKLTKTNTVSFRGEQRKTLLEYGSTFKVLTFKEKIFRLEPYETDSESKAVADAKASLDNFVKNVNLNGGSEDDDLPF